MTSAGTGGGEGGGRDRPDPARRLPLPSRARVTLRTEGVTPLVLPDEEGRPSLELDTSELQAPPPHPRSRPRRSGGRGAQGARTGPRPECQGRGAGGSRRVDAGPPRASW